METSSFTQISTKNYHFLNCNINKHKNVLNLNLSSILNYEPSYVWIWTLFVITTCHKALYYKRLFLCSRKQVQKTTWLFFQIQNLVHSWAFIFPTLWPTYYFNICNNSELTCLSNSSTISFWTKQADFVQLSECNKKTRAFISFHLPSTNNITCSYVYYYFNSMGYVTTRIIMIL